MQQDQFVKLMIEVLGGEIARIDFEKVSPDYNSERSEFETILQSIETLPLKVDTEAGPVDIQETITKLDDLWSTSMEIGFDVGLKMGFSLAFKFIFYTLTTEPEKWLTEGGTKTQL